VGVNWWQRGNEMSKLTDQESEYIAKLLDKRHAELIHELHHAVTRDYKDGLKREIQLTEDLKSKFVST
jgi:hypothetical protein